MKLKVIKYGGKEETFNDISSFEFRTNQGSNWIKVKSIYGDTVYIYNVCVIKSVE